METARTTLTQKLFLVQGKIGSISKSSYNPHFKSKFADLNEVLSVAKAALGEQGLYTIQTPGADAYGRFVETAVVDADSGTQYAGKVYFSGTEDTMQKIGAAITYARRFGLVSLLALESEDDDGETAVGRGDSLRNNREQPAPQGANGGAKASVPSAASPKIQAATLPKPPTKEKLLKDIATAGKVIVDSKRGTTEEVVAILHSYGVKDKAELTEDQAKDFLAKLREMLK